ncbi:hypothetical protein CGK93_04825 [Arthrobacter sp. YN]|nr:hypothetical protein CGK93_04825 [Arthrobacter sp. YN]
MIVVSGITTFMFLPLLTLELVQRGLGIASVGILVGSMTGSGQIASVFLGFLVARFGSKTMALCGLVIRAAGLSVFLFREDFTSYLVGSIVAGIGSTSVSLGIKTELLAVAGSRKLISLRSAAVNSGALLGPAIGAVLFQLTGFNTIIAASLISYLIMGVVVAFLRFESSGGTLQGKGKHSEPGQDGPLFSEKTRKPILVLLTLVAAYWFAYSQWNVLMPLTAKQAFGTDQASSWFYIANAALILGFQYLLLVHLLGRLKSARILLLGFGSLFAGFLVLALGWTAPAVIAYVVFFTLGETLVSPTLDETASRLSLGHKRLGKLFGLIGTISGAASVAGGALTGWILSAAGAPGLASTVGLLAGSIGILLSIRGLRKKGPTMTTTIYIPSPRGVVLEAAQKIEGLQLVPVVSAKDAGDAYRDMRVLKVSDPLDALEVARALLDEPDDGSRRTFLAFGDQSTEVASMVNAALGWGIAGYLDFQTLEAFRNKSRLRKALGKNNPMNLPFADVRDAEEVIRFVRMIGTQAILKPTDGSGSRNILTLSPSTVEQDLSEQDHSWIERGGIVEAMAIGPEFSVEVLSWKGEHSVLGTTRKFTSGAPHFIETGHQFPADIPAKLRTALEKATKQVLDAAGHQSGLSHTEFIADSSGVKLIESHGRPGGDRISDLVGLATGRSSFDLWFATLLSESLASVPETTATAGVEFLDLTGLTATDDQWMSAMREVPGVVEASVLLDEPHRGSIVSSSSRHSLVVFRSDPGNHDEIRNTIRATNMELT